MADDRIREEVITNFLLNTCQVSHMMSEKDVHALKLCAEVIEKFNLIPLLTGSAAEFYIQPMLSCVGDFDIMCHATDQLVIPAGYTPPTQLPGKFGSHVEVCEIMNTEFPGYVYLESAYLLLQTDDDRYKVRQCERHLATIEHCLGAGESIHGPAVLQEKPTYSLSLSMKQTPSDKSGTYSLKSHYLLRPTDTVLCVRCLVWPPQAADWPTRQRNCGWPDSATVDHVVSNGCDVVPVPHHLCKQNEWMKKHQFRLSFSRAEISLLNSWLKVQQSVYHTLRRFMKTQQVTDSAANDPGTGTLSNYHIKTLMLWACEVKSSTWWTDNLNLVRICVKLLHTLAVWLTEARCKHYFINNCNLFDRFENSQFTAVTANRLKSLATAFCEWCIDNYIYKCIEHIYPSSVSTLAPPSRELHGVICLQEVVSEIVKWQHEQLPLQTSFQFFRAQGDIIQVLSSESLTLQSCLCWLDQLAKSDQVLHIYFTAVVFLHVAYKTTQSFLGNDMLDVLATTTCLQLNDVRRCLDARRSSVLSLSQAAILMKVVANSLCSTVQLIEIELAKAYLHRALKYKDSDSSSVYCLAHVLLAVLYYTTKQYQMVIDHVKLVKRLQDHSQCSSHVVQGEILPRIDEQVDNILGLAVFYQYIRADKLNEEHEIRHVSVFTTELFAHCLHVKLLSITKCHHLSQTSPASEFKRYQDNLCNLPEVFVTDVMLFNFVNHTILRSNDRLVIANRGETTSLICQLDLDTSKLVELLQQSAVEHLTICREFQAPASFAYVVTPDFKALYAYKHVEYERCLQLSIDNADIDANALLPVFLYPELIQLMDDDLVSLEGLVTMVNRSHKSLAVSQLSLSLYLMTQCQIKLRYPVTSLAKTLDRFQLIRDEMREDADVIRSFSEHVYFIDQLVIKFLEQKILRYRE